MSNRIIEKLLNGATVEWKPLGNVAELKRGKVISKMYLDENKGIYPVYSSQTMNNGEIGKINSFDFDGEFLTWTTDGANAGTVFYRNGRFSITNVCGLIKAKECLNHKFLFYWLSIEAKKYVYSGMGNPKLMSNQIEKILIPIPPLEIQQKIVKTLDKFTELEATLEATLEAELALRKKQYQYYRETLLTFSQDLDRGGYNDITKALYHNTPVVFKALGEVFDISAGGDVPKDALSEEKTVEFNIPILSNGIEEKSLYGWTNAAKINKPSLTISARGTIGWVSYREEPFFPIVRLIVLTPKIEINLKYAYYYMKLIENDYKIPETGIPQLTKPMIKDIKIPVPTLTEQQKIVKILDKFDRLTNSISEGLPKEIALRRKQYEYYREQLLYFQKS
ncbi:restriction endonuclease subunit S [Mannheimia pernigra]|uniref:restriction endonuclease subunit S n=1 Tax=Mannheimia pernigra TaxID=111844 RepID=UPI00159F4EE5|nr:restriction endonuclease subunit S [Mannheimia pernigra]QLB44240.1 restriction endonuclease subunit S [Mannheimia pernigra]